MDVKIKRLKQHLEKTKDNDFNAKANKLLARLEFLGSEKGWAYMQNLSKNG